VLVLKNNLFLRVVSTVVMIPCAFWLTKLGGMAFSFAVAACLGLMLFELFDAFDLQTGRDDLVRRLKYTLIVSGIVAVCLMSVGDQALSFIMLGIIWMSSLLAGSVKCVYAEDGKEKRSLDFMKGLYFSTGVLYCILPSLAVIWMRGENCGFPIVIFLFSMVWSTDIGSYCVGKVLGGKRLCPSISPNKTWAGVWGGLGTSLLVSMAFFWWCDISLGVWQLAAACICSICAQMGDLFESFVKRRLNLKDSGNLIPGHGGILDRVDSLIPVICLVALLMLVYEVGQIIPVC